jgi:protein TonB
VILTMKKYIHIPIVMCLAALAAESAFAQSKPEPPVPVRTVSPDYPSELRRDGVSGVVMVSCTIDVKGDVQDAAIEKSTNARFNPSALAAVKKWKFKPAKVDGAPVAKKVTSPLKFTVDET